MATTLDDRRQRNVFTWLVQGVVDHFTQRVTCWCLAAMSVIIGVQLMADPAAFPDYARFSSLERIAPLSGLGATLVVVGFLRVIALVINGSFQTSWWTAYLRMVLSGISAVLWAQLAIASVWYSTSTLDAAILPFLALMDVYNTGHAATETQRPWH